MKKLIVIAILFALLAGAVYGQGIPGIPDSPGKPAVAGFTSPQSQATQGRIRSWADDYIRPDSYANVAVKNWYGMASFESTLRGTIGYAAKIGGGEGEDTGKPLFLGLFYRGQAWANVTQFAYDQAYQAGSSFAGTDKYVDRYTSPLAKNPTGYAGYPGYNADFNNPANAALFGSSATTPFFILPENQIAVLIGVADMGFRVSFITTLESFKVSNAYVRNVLTEAGTEPNEVVENM